MGLKLNINGAEREVRADPDTPLLFVLREELKLKGAKLGCGLEQCGACHVLADGVSVPSCVAPAGSFEGKKIVTVEGLSESEIGRRVQAAFVKAGAAQCGYCTAGLVIGATALLTEMPHPDREAAKAALNPHLCRCGAHPRVLKAVEMAARR